MPIQPGRSSRNPALKTPRIDFSTGLPRSDDYGDVYHAEAGALAQARHVFLAGNGLPQRWAGRRQFAILETGFGLGHNFLATWEAWKGRQTWNEREASSDREGSGADLAADPPSAFLDVVAIEQHPPTRDDLRRAHALSGAPAALSEALIDAWPVALRGLHRLHFDGGCLRLTLAFGEAGDLMPALSGPIDAFYLDGFAPHLNPAMWDPRLMKALGRLAAPGATLATWSVARHVQDGLTAAGFEVTRAPGFHRKRWMTVARHAPRAAPRAPAGRAQGPWSARREAVIVGAGLAGAAVAHALATRGWRCTVLEAAREPAQGASGNPAGLFHGVVHPTDGVHARLHRAAALFAERHHAPLIRQGRLPGAANGMLVVHPEHGVDNGSPSESEIGTQAPSSPPSHTPPRRRRDRPPEPLPGFAEWLNTEQASAVAGVSLTGPALHYPHGGWIAPNALVRHWLSTPGVQLVCGAEVADFRAPKAPGDDGFVVDAAGRVLAQAPLIVLANGPGLQRWADTGRIDLPALGTSVGRISWADAAGDGPRVPVSGHGYALRLTDGRLFCGATSRPPGDATTPEDDHRWNLERLANLTGQQTTGTVEGRQGLRLGTPDRLPLIGPLPAEAPATTPATASAGRSRALAEDQPRRIPRMPGVFVASAFGSRGLIWAPLAAELIASWVEGTPLPLESDLVDAVDPARARARRARRQADGSESPAPRPEPGASDAAE
jgi:tRNA 5-methylaminomethyl-2-thiouridine biosynthesis bifunctional protein